MSYIKTSDDKKTHLVGSREDIIKNIIEFNSCEIDFILQLLKFGRVFVYSKDIGLCPSRFCGYLNMSQEKWGYLYNLDYGLDGTKTTEAITKIIGRPSRDENLDLVLSNKILSARKNKKYWCV
jgi:hypothetical protein